MTDTREAVSIQGTNGDDVRRIQAEAQRTLQERAERLRQESEQQREETDALHLVEFALGDERYALDAGRVLEIHPLASWTKIPCTPSAIVGAVNLRGQIVSIIDIRPLLGLAFEGPCDGAHVIVVESPLEEKVEALPLAVLTDAVPRMRTVDPSALDDRSSASNPRASGLVRGVTGHLLALLDLEALFRDVRIGVPNEG